MRSRPHRFESMCGMAHKKASRAARLGYLVGPAGFASLLRKSAASGFSCENPSRARASTSRRLVSLCARDLTGSNPCTGWHTKKPRAQRGLDTWWAQQDSRPCFASPQLRDSPARIPRALARRQAAGLSPYALATSPVRIHVRDGTQKSLARSEAWIPGGPSRIRVLASQVRSFGILLRESLARSRVDKPPACLLMRSRPHRFESMYGMAHKKASRAARLGYLVGPAGFEPATQGL